MIELRDYQAELVANVGQALRRVRRVLMVLPPGGGKTVIAAFIAQRFAQRGAQVWFNCHRDELLKQTSLTFANCGLPHSFIAADRPMMLGAPVQVCSVPTLKNRIQHLAAPRVMLWDECHHIGAAGWAAIMAAYPDTLHIGLTGSPWRLDGSPLGAYFEELVMGPTPAQLIEWGNLAPYEMFAPSAPDMKGVRKQMGEFAKGETEARMRAPKLTGDIIKHWKRRADGLRTVGYGMTVPHSQYMADLFNAAGIPAAHLDGNTPNAERRSTIERYAAGEILVLWNVGLFGEGFDLSAWAGRPVTIDAGILANPTMSLSKYLQESMRPMRPAPGKVAVILDHAGNSNRHGYPDDERDWTLDGSGKKGGAANDNGPPPPVTCPGCFRQLRQPLPDRCPTCGHEFDKPKPEDLKEIEFLDEDLQRVTEDVKRHQRQQRAKEEAEAKTLDQLVALGKSRGYKFPAQWAQKKMGGRMAKQRRYG